MNKPLNHLKSLDLAISILDKALALTEMIENLDIRKLQEDILTSGREALEEQRREVQASMNRRPNKS